MQSSSKVEEKVVVVVNKDKLHQQFLNLQQEWLSFKQSIPRTRALHRYHHDHDHHPTKSNPMVKTLTFLENSPRNLMSSLQRGSSPSEGAMRKVIKTANGSAVEDVIRERREAIEGGALKGRRRLFEAAFGESETDFGEEEDGGNDWNYNTGTVQESHEVRSALSFDDSDEENDKYSVGSREIPVCSQGYPCSLSGQKVDDEGEKMMKREEAVARVDEEEKRVNGNGGRSLVIIMRWLALASVVFAICIIRSFGQNDDENKVILVPT
ncbi:hypothetical protein TorRG33x02_085750 [Trema orientale]|uniref:Transmembrane protein n=1 Tax=Trema orientale TaxID=63057 RepID=A0A2P5FDB9_TREOI|nr:hypothetical protein TorRG33x02_085750 [Trema orientale]